MFLIGLTGGIATGKTTVSNVFRSKNISVIDADIIARNVVAPNRKAWHKLRQTFGLDIFHEDGTLNREALGKIIFNNKEKRRVLNEITHPEIVKEMAWDVIKCFFQGYKYVVMDLPLLYETSYMLDYLHKIIVVRCDKELQLLRVMERHGLNELDANLRINAQMSLDEKCSKANFVIENSGSREETEKQVLRLIEIFDSSNHHWKLRGILAFWFLAIISLLWFGFKFLR